MLYTPEFYELMEYFEKTASKQWRLHSKLVREPKENWPKGWYYSNGEDNQIFQIFLSGYMFGKTSN